RQVLVRSTSDAAYGATAHDRAVDARGCRSPDARGNHRGSGRLLEAVYGDVSGHAGATGRRADGIRLPGEQPVRVCQRSEIAAPKVPARVITEVSYDEMDLICLRVDRDDVG